MATIIWEYYYMHEKDEKKYECLKGVHTNRGSSNQHMANHESTRYNSQNFHKMCIEMDALLCLHDPHKIMLVESTMIAMGWKKLTEYVIV